MRAALDSLYRFALWLSALCLAGIVLIVGLQLLGRIVDGALNLMGVPVYGFVILSMAEIAGYLLAAASFLALAGTLKAGAHIRVTMFLGGLSDGARRWAELWTLGFAAVFSGYMTWHIAVFAYFSWAYDRSEEHTSELQSPCNLVCRLLL